MNQAFYTATVGAQQQMTRMGVQANNVANVNTYGYKGLQAGFANLMYGNFNGADDEELSRGAGSVIVQTATDWSQSYLSETTRTLDFAIEGDGLFAFYDPATANVTFSRDGSFAMSHVTIPSADGGEDTEGWYLTNASGLYVVDMQGNFIPMDPTADSLTFTADSLNIGVFDYAIKDGMERVGANGFANIDKNGMLQIGTGTVRQGYLEGSNVDLATEITKVIESQRLYTYALKMIQTSDEVETVINGLKG